MRMSPLRQLSASLLLTTVLIGALLSQPPASRAGSAAAATASLALARVAHTATLLTDGQVLVVGGNDGDSLGANALAGAERYDLTTDRWVGARGKSRIWVSQGFRHEYHKAQAVKLAIIDAAFEACFMSPR